MIVTINEFKTYITEMLSDKEKYARREIETKLFNKHKNILSPEYNRNEKNTNILTKDEVLHFLTLTKNDNCVYWYKNINDNASKTIYNFKSYNGQLRANNSVSGIFDATIFNSNRLPDDLRVVVNIDRIEYENDYKQELTNELLEEVKEFIENLPNTTLQLSSETENDLEYSTRENGDVGSETYSMEDVKDARIVRNALLQKFKKLDISIETVDEWVHLNIQI